jgi:hypothetical protein
MFTYALPSFFLYGMCAIYGYLVLIFWYFLTLISHEKSLKILHVNSLDQCSSSTLSVKPKKGNRQNKITLLWTKKLWTNKFLVFSKKIKVIILELHIRIYPHALKIVCHHESLAPISLKTLYTYTVFIQIPIRLTWTSLELDP